MNKPTTDELVAWLREQATDYNHHPFAQMTLAAAAEALSATPTREELLAMVERLKGELDLLMRDAKVAVSVGCDGLDESESPYYFNNLENRIQHIDVLTLTPADALADLKARVRREVLEEAKDSLKNLVQSGSGAVSVGRNAGIADCIVHVSRMAEEGK
jgi:hypothetical protein